MQRRHVADGYTRATGKMSMMIAQNGPGITNFVTPVKTAYWNHTPLLLVTPQAANKTIGQGGFQEIEQMKLFEDMVCYQEEVRDPSRMAEVLNRVIEKAWRGFRPGPDQRAARLLDTGHRHRIAANRSPRASELVEPQAIDEAAKLLSEAKFPVILNGAGVVLPARFRHRCRLPRSLSARSAAAISTMMPFPAPTRMPAGPLGYNGSKAAMELIAKADVVLGAWNPPQPVLHPPRLWHRLLAEGSQDHSGRHQFRPDRPDQEGFRRHPGRRQNWLPSKFSKNCRHPPATQAARSARPWSTQTKSAWLQAAVINGSRGRRSGHQLERTRP